MMRKSLNFDNRFILPCRISRAFIAVFLLAGISARETAGQTADKEQIVSVIDAFHSALAAGDSVSALGYLASDVTILESGGVENKAHYRSGHLAGDMRFAQAVRRERGKMEISIIGDVGWAHSTSTTEGSMDDRDINSVGAELVVLARENGTWKIKAIHWSSRQRR